MKSTKGLIGAFALGIAAALSLPVIAGEAGNMLMKMCDNSSDGKITKTQVMTAVDTMFDRHDERKEGKLNKKQLDAFLKQFTAQSGA